MRHEIPFVEQIRKLSVGDRLKLEDKYFQHPHKQVSSLWFQHHHNNFHPNNHRTTNNTTQKTEKYDDISSQNWITIRYKNKIKAPTLSTFKKMRARHILSRVPTSLTYCFQSTSSEHCTAPLYWLQPCYCTWSCCLISFISCGLTCLHMCKISKIGLLTYIAVFGLALCANTLHKIEQQLAWHGLDAARQRLIVDILRE